MLVLHPFDHSRFFNFNEIWKDSNILIISIFWLFYQLFNISMFESSQHTVQLNCKRLNEKTSCVENNIDHYILLAIWRWKFINKSSKKSYYITSFGYFEENWWRNSVMDGCRKLVWYKCMQYSHANY